VGVTVGTVAEVDELRAVVAAAETVSPVGAGTHWEVGNPPTLGVEVHAPAGVLAYDPAELTVTVWAGTTVGALTDALAQSGQECVLDPRSANATVGGTIATGLSGPRRLRYGPLRDRVLEVRFVTADGRLVKGGGATVKNVTGFDLPRLLVGSMGTIGVLTQVTLRCQPLAAIARWAGSADDPAAVRARLFRPSCVAWDGALTRVLLEGHPADVEAEERAAGLEPLDDRVLAVDGEHRGRISVRPDRVRETGRALQGCDGVEWMAELGVGTIHVATATVEAFAAARAVAEGEGGWLLREAGAPGVDGYGVALPNAGILRRVRDAFDPTGKLSPGRFPLEVSA
jgi:glycolate oxidase FAD binding subunit